MADVSSTPTTSSATPAAPHASFAEDFIDIFYAPSAVFERRRGASPWPTILVVTGLVAVATYIYFTLFGPAFERDMLRSLPPDMPAEARATAMGFSRWMALFGGVVTVPVTVLVLGLVLWLLGKLFDADQSLRAAFLVVAFSWMPRVVETILTSLQAFMMDVNALPSLLSASLTAARFVDAAATPGLAQALSRVGPFVIWSYVIVAIGLKVTGRIGIAKAAIAATILWVVGAVPSLLALARG